MFWRYISFSKYLSFLILFLLLLFSELFFGEFFETLVIVAAILFPIKWPNDSAFFWTALFGAVSTASVPCLVWLRSFWLYLLLLNVFSYILTHNSSQTKRQKSIAFYKYSIPWLNWIVCHFLYVILYMLYFDVPIPF